jgi:hypothetical protein
MNGNEPAQRIWFIIIFFIVAFIINSTPHLSFSTQNVRLQQQVPAYAPPVASQQQQEQAAAAQKSATDAAAEHSRFLARYLNAGFPRTPGNGTLALVVATENGQLDHPVGTALANHFKSGNVEISTSLFKPEFVSDKLFANVFGGSTEILNKLELANSLDALLLARETVQYSKDSSLDNLISANMQLEIQVVPVAGNIQNQSWTFTANGAGFSQAEAKSMAVERLIKQINNDTKMSLGF